MRIVRLVTVALLTVTITGCYISREPLIGDDAVATHAVVTFLAEGEDGEPVVFTREGNGYRTSSDGNEARLHLKPVSGDYYVAQLSGPGDDGGTEYLYGYIRFDASAGVAETWLTLAIGESAPPGFSECDDMLCIDDLAAYIALGQETVASGTEPDTTFAITVE